MTLAELIEPWALAFTFTQIVEVPIYARALAGRRAAVAGAEPPASSERARLAVAFGASAITHPIVWFVFPWFFARWIPVPRPLDPYWTMVVFAELFAWLVEAAWLRAFALRRAIGWSLVANGASLGLGLLSRAIFGYP